MWKNANIVITGSGGFVGKHLMAHYASKGARVIGITRHPKSLSKEIKIDLLDKDTLRSVVSRNKPHAFFHLASEAIVEVGQSRPYETFQNNILTTLNVLEVCRILRVPRIIIVSTAHVYGDAPQPHREDEPARPSRPYETSKTASDLIAQSYADSFNLPVLIPRFVNIYGPGDMSTTRIVPKTITSVLSGKAPTLWGGNAKRDYLFIDDAISAYDALGRISDSQIERNRIYNFATGRSVTARKLIQTILALMGTSTTIQRIADVRTNELMHQEVDWTKAKRILGWAPKTDRIKGLTETIRWYKTHYDSLN